MCSECVSGQIAVAGACVACLASSNCHRCASADNLAQCLTCQANHRLVNGVCSLCPAAQYSTHGSTTYSRVNNLLTGSVMDIIARLAIISLELLALLVLRIMASVLEHVLCVLVDFTLLEE